MKLTVWDVGKSNIEKIPEPERSLIIGLGHIANEVNILQKFLYWTIPEESDSEISRHAHAVQSLFVAKLLAAKISETWQFLSKSYFGSRLSKEYEDLLDDNGMNALNDLRIYFGRTNTLTSVRNEFVFHYSLEQIQKGLSCAKDDEVWRLVMSSAAGNSLYYLSDLVLNYAMFDQINKADHSRAMDILIADTIKLAKAILIFCESCWVVALDRHLKDSGSEYHNVEVNDCPRLQEVRIPFFVEMQS